MPPEHLVVLMLENRSFDNMLGFLYDRQHPPTIRQPADNHIFYGLDFQPDGTAAPADKWAPSDEYWNPSNASYFANPPGALVKVAISPAPDFTTPHPDPGEHFDRITA